MTPLPRPLAGRAIGLSISESEDSSNRGFPAWQVNRITLQVVAALFGQGASIIFGHDWREDGVMEAVYGFARQMQPPVPMDAKDAEVEGQPLLRNLLPWPDTPYLPELELEQLRSTLRVESAGLPEELRLSNPASDAGPQDSQSPVYRYVRARGLTHLRHRLNEMCDARLCLGGRRSGSAGRYPGVIEEAVLALRAHKPLYLAGLLGGATQQVVEAIGGRVMPEDFCIAPPIQRLYNDPPIRELNIANRQDRHIDRQQIWQEFRDAGIEQLADSNGLTREENDELLHTPALDRVIELTLIGLSRLGPRATRKH
jgi:SLOG cluster2